VRLPVYLDWNATTPVDPRVLEAMLPCFSEDFGNASSTSHAYGWKAEARVRLARAAVASAIGAAPEEIVFTSGATESDALALLGAARANRDRGDHLVVAATEHRAVLDHARRLESEGFRLTLVPPRADGRIAAATVASALTDRTLLVSVMAANNETGALNPVGEIGALCRERGVLFHTDAAQALGKVPLDVRAIGVDLVSLSAHKACGPKGVGALWVRSGKPRVRLEAQLLGGGHERGLRSGTPNVPAIVGFGEAARIAAAELATEPARLRALRDRLEAEILAGVPGARRNGPGAERLPNTLNVLFPGVEAGRLMLEARDLAVSSGSACSSASPEPSHVLVAMGLSAAEARSSIRISLGRFTTEEEVGFAAGALLSAWRSLSAS